MGHVIAQTSIRGLAFDITHQAECRSGGGMEEEKWRRRTEGVVEEEEKWSAAV